jgi:xanthine dehydrogenase YagS FAD-binding subunit
MNAFEWTEASNVDQAIRQLGDKVVLKAGGVDLLDLMKEHLIEPVRLVNIRNVKGLDRIVDDPKSGLRIGPMVTLARLDADATVRRRYPALADAAGHAATPQIRNMATLGGNLLQRPRCWYFRNEQFHCKKKGGEICYAQTGENQYHAIFDNEPCAIVHPSGTATALVAYGARLELTGPKGKREVKAEDFFILPKVDVHRENTLGPDEVLTEVRVPPPAPGSRAVYIKQGEMESHDWPIAEVAVVMERDGDTCRRASIILGAASPVPHRATEAEDLLRGKRVDEALATKAAEAALDAADPLTHNEYKLPLFTALIRRALLAAVAVEGTAEAAQAKSGGGGR